MKLLFLCNKSPYPALEGGPMAMNSMIEGMIEAGHQVKVLAVNSEKYHIQAQDIPNDYRQKTGIELIHIDLRIKVWDALMTMLAGRSYHVERFISATFKEKLIQLLHSSSYDAVQLETLFMAPYIPVIRKHSKAVIVLRAHNIEHLIWERIADQTRFFPKRWYIRHLATTLKQYELNSLRSMDGIAAITRKDAQFFRQYSSCPVIDIPFGVSPEKYLLSDSTPRYPDTIFHIGAMNWIPNEEGIRWFLENVWPLIHHRLPKLRFVLAGRFMPSWLLQQSFPKVEVVGEVPDAQEFIRDHGIAVVPLLSGSGIRIKIIEAMALAKAVITTEVGAEGIFYTSGKHLFIAHQPEEFADAVEQLIRQPETASQMGHQARLLVEEMYDHRRIIDRMLLFYKELIRKQSKLK